MGTYQRLEMPYYLVQSYADLSRAQESQFRQAAKVGPYDGFSHNFALLSINAAIVEGTLRSILHWFLFEEQEKATKKGVKLGETQPDLPARTLIKLRLDVDTSDTWSKLKEQFKYLFGKALADVVGKNVITEIEFLFVIRNRAAHGSSIQIPKESLTKDDDEYLFSLQNKLEKLTKYLDEKHKTTGIYEGLGHRDTAQDFWRITQLFASKLTGLYPYPPELHKNMDAIIKYEFGKVYVGP